MNRIEIKNVTKRFGDVVALDDVTLSLEENKIYGLLGRNGAGKTTLLNIMTNHLFADAGEVRIDGVPVKENDKALASIFMMSERGNYPDSMRVEEVFKWTSRFYDGAFDMDYAMRLCEAFSLNPRKKVKQLSTGYSSIYKLIAALSLRIPFILLDEPVLGLDANHRELLYKLILETYAEHPRTIVISTHLIEEVSALIEEVIIIKEGRMIKQASSEELLSAGYTVTGAAAQVDLYAQGKTRIGEDALGGLKTVYLMGKPEADMPEGLEVSKLDLQKLFIQMTNH